MRRKLLLGLLLVMVAAAGWVVTGPLRAWRSIERVHFDPTAAREQLLRQANPVAVTTPPPQLEVRLGETPTVEIPASHSVERTDPPSAALPTVTTHQLPAASAEADTVPSGVAAHDNLDIDLRDDLDVFLILGSDARPNKESVRADAIMLLITSRTESLLVSMPRRLNLVSPCTGAPAPINTNLEGCGDVSGLDLTAIAVEDYTGLSVDHLVMFGFDGFQSIIDRIGGLEVCVENPVKLSANAAVFLEAGCSQLDGTKALQWVRSRMTLELAGGKWTLMQGAGDAARTERERQVVLQVLRQLDEFDSPGALNSIVRELADSFILDSGWDLPEAVSLAWDLRSISRGAFRSTAVDTAGAVTADGEFVLEPTGPFSDLLVGIFT